MSSDADAAPARAGAGIVLTDLVAAVLGAVRGVVPRRLLKSIHRRLPAGGRRRLDRVVRTLRRRARVKVSVIVAAYNSDQAGLERLVASLDAQSLPRQEFEVVFVDDGSSDDTLARLRAFARTRPHFVVHSIPNSGWSSRPRNAAIELARGDYVLFMDHDDELFPEALERAHACGRLHRADVVNAKEVRTRGWSWGWNEFAQDLAPGDESPTVPLLPMTPHKVYRRAFLNRAGIRFPEGKRVLWEDIHFNVACLAAGARVAVVTGYPFYHWVATDANNSATYGRDVAEFWDHLSRLLDGIDTALSQNRWRQPLLTHQIRGRVLGQVGPGLLRRSAADRAFILEQATDLVQAHLPVDVDAELTPVDRARVQVLRAGHVDAQLALATVDQGVTAVPRVDDLRWEDGLLVLTASATLTDASGEPVRFRRSGDRWLRDLPAEVAAVVTTEARDVTDSLASARFSISVRGRESRSTWPVHGVGEVRIVDEVDGIGHLVAHAEARFDVGTTPERDWDGDPVWDFAARLEACGYVAHRALRGGRPAVALVRGRSAIAYENRDGNLSLDVSNAARSVTGSARPVAEDVQLASTHAADGLFAVHCRVPLTSVHAHGDVRIAGEVVFGDGSQGRAELLADDTGARLEFQSDLPPGDHRVKTRFNGRAGETGLVLSVTPDGVSVRQA